MLLMLFHYTVAIIMVVTEVATGVAEKLIK